MSKEKCLYWRACCYTACIDQLFMLFFKLYIITIMICSAAFSYQSLFNLSLTLENCNTSVICSSTSRAGSCSVGFSFTSSNQELVAVAFNKSLNVQFDLLLDRSTEYYVQANVTVDGTAFQLRRNFSTGKCEREKIYSLPSSLPRGGSRKKEERGRATHVQ